jgi:hypothetical protein
MRFTRRWQHSGAMMVAVATVAVLAAAGLASAAGPTTTLIEHLIVIF